MPRARNIKPGFFKNEELVEIAFEYRLLFAGLWVLADRCGRLEDRPKRIKMELFPADNVDIDAGLEQLQERGFLIRYEVENQRYIQVLNFERHQNPHKNEAPSSIPAPEQHGASTVQAPEQHGGTHADSLIPDSLIPEEKPIGPSDDAPREKKRESSGYTPEFEAAWRDYPKRKGGNSKLDAFAAWKARIRQGRTPEEMHAGILRYAEFCRSTGKIKTEFVKQAAVFLGNKLHFAETWAEEREITLDEINMIDPDAEPERFRDMVRAYNVQEKAKPMPDWMRESC